MSYLELVKSQPNPFKIWVSCKFMTDNYENIIIGDIKTQEIVKIDGVIGGITKDMMHALKFYKFKQRAEYKCKCKGNNFMLINEYGSTKICSECGHYNDVGGSTVYDCKKCGLHIGRDQNPTRSFIMLAKEIYN